MQLQSWLLVFLPALLSLTSAAPLSNVTLVERARLGSPLDPGSPTAVVQWTSENGNLNNMRNYHIRKDGHIMESRRNSRDSGWTTTETGLKAHAGGGLAAAVHKLSENTDDVEVRLFYQHETPNGYDAENKVHYYRMKAAVRPPNTNWWGWQVDTQFFNQVGYIANPRSAITFVDSNKVVQWRVYFTSSQEGQDWSWMKAAMNLYGEWTNPIHDYTWNTIYEAKFPTNGVREWSMGNSGRGFAKTQQPQAYPGAVAAVAWKAGTRISLFYWDTDGLDDYNPVPGVIREMRWRDGGWNLQPVPNGDFRGFSPSGSLAAVTWVDGSGVDQIRLYAKWAHEPGMFTGNYLRVVEFGADANGWGKQSEDFPKYWTSNSHAHFPLSAVAWTYPDRNNVHIRVHFPECASIWGGSCTANQEAYVHEVQYNTGEGWKNSGNIDY